MAVTLYFYDLETSGINPRDARVMQFAGIRTDIELNPIGEPHNILIKLTADVLPEPDAVLITGITPQQTFSEGITEAEFLKIFHEEIAIPGTIFTGFNTVRFDDEFMRYLQYRNFYDPYEWQYKDNRSRWDLLDVVRMTRALRPEGIKWPVNAKGKATNRLEWLTSINELEHKSAHDALSDVKAVIAVARMIRDKQPKLFDFLLNIRDKNKAAQLAHRGEPFLYTSGKYSDKWEKTTAVGVLAEHPRRQGVLVYDLRVDPKPFAKMKPEELADIWKWSKEDKSPRLPIKTLQFNRCPAIAPLNVLDENSQERLSLNPDQIAKNYQKLLKVEGFADRVLEALEILEARQQLKFLEDETEVDAQLYDGFFESEDKTKMSVVRAASVEELSHLQVVFKDQRLQNLLPLYKARNYPKAMSDEDRVIWERFRERKLLGGKEASKLARYFARLEELKSRTDITQNERYLLEELELYGQSILPSDAGY
jgi:exodeoxyribonuclease I